MPATIAEQPLEEADVRVEELPHHPRCPRVIVGRVLGPPRRRAVPEIEQPVPEHSLPGPVEVPVERGQALLRRLPDLLVDSGPAALRGAAQLLDRGRQRRFEHHRRAGRRRLLEHRREALDVPEQLGVDILPERSAANERDVGRRRLLVRHPHVEVGFCGAAPSRQPVEHHLVVLGVDELVAKSREQAVVALLERHRT